MANNIELVKSVNGIPFGAGRDEVTRAFGQPNRSFKKTPLSKVETDAYDLFNVHYTNDYRLEAVEFTKGAEITVNGSPIPWDYNAIKAWILAIDPGAEIEDDGITSSANGIGVFAVGNDVQSLLFASADYYI